MEPEHEVATQLADKSVTLNDTTATHVHLVAGALAGLSVDISLFPLDTIKTRLQSGQGFFKAGGFRGIYSGLSSAAIGSAPGASLFFTSYGTVKAKLEHTFIPEPVVHMTAAACGEVAACIARVPTEVVKQRAQANPGTTPLNILKSTVKTEGLQGLYRGYISTVLREIPFSFIQFPLWEWMKKIWSEKQGHKVDAWQSAVSGAVSGGVAAGVTTPLDVAKTRIMLAKSGTDLARGSISMAVKQVYLEEGIRGLFAGVVPRVIWIAIGGAIFLGVYDKVKDSLNRYENQHR